MVVRCQHVKELVLYTNGDLDLSAGILCSAKHKQWVSLRYFLIDRPQRSDPQHRYSRVYSVFNCIQYVRSRATMDCLRTTELHLAVM